MGHSTLIDAVLSIFIIISPIGEPPAVMYAFNKDQAMCYKTLKAQQKEFQATLGSKGYKSVGTCIPTTVPKHINS